MRLIDADVLLNTFNDYCATECAICRFYKEEKSGGHLDFRCGLIDNAPTVEPSRPHGEWQECENTLYTGGGYTKCSNCGMRYSWGGYHEVFEFAYCPTCGANMRPTETLSETAGKVADDCLNRIMGGGI